MEYRFNLGVLEGSLTSSLGEHDCKFIPVSMSNNSSRRLQIATGGPRIKNQAALKRSKELKIRGLQNFMKIRLTTFRFKRGKADFFTL